MAEPPRLSGPSRGSVPDGATATAYDAAWVVDAPTGPRWTARPWVHPTARVEEAKAARKQVPKPSHVAFEPRPGRDPIVILEAQEADRLQELGSLRHARMAESALAVVAVASLVILCRERALQ